MLENLKLFNNLKEKLNFIISRLRNSNRGQMYLTLKTLGCNKRVLHANMPISHSYYHNMTTERQHRR